MDSAAIAAMLAADREEWAALCAALDARPDSPLHDPESPEWTARDVYTHLARMMEATTKAMEAKLAGHAIPDWENGDDEAENRVNAEIQRTYSHMTLDEARDWGQREFERRVEVIASIPGDGWDAQLEKLAVADGGRHYRGHRGYIIAR